MKAHPKNKPFFKNKLFCFFRLLESVKLLFFILYLIIYSYLFPNYHKAGNTYHRHKRPMYVFPIFELSFAKLRSTVSMLKPDKHKDLEQIITFKLHIRLVSAKTEQESGAVQSCSPQRWARTRHNTEKWEQYTPNTRIHIQVRLRKLSIFTLPVLLL